MKEEFKFKIFNEALETTLSDVFTALQNNEMMKAYDICCRYYAARNSQVHVDAALEAYKKYLKEEA